MNRKTAIFLLFASFMFLSVFAQASTDKFIPSGMKCRGILSEELNSNNITVGQIVQLYLFEDLKYNDTTIAPKGSTVIGTVVKNNKSTDEINAQTQVRFTSIRTPYNNIIPISAIIETKDKTGVLEGNKDISILANTKINILFDQPITVIAR